MKLVSFVVSLAGVAQLAQSLENPLEGYKIVDFEWEVQTSPEGALHHVNGTVEDVFRYLKEVDPTYEVPEAPAQELATRESRLDPRQTKHICFVLPLAYANPIQDGINYLYRVPGTATNGPGPGECGRVSCSDNAGIWWCNDNRFAYTLPSYRVIADGVQNVKQQCLQSVNGRTMTSGQGFFDGNWNVIFGGGTTC
ncbi:hypothetical protein Daus18300_013718 [Diaporthe australafricana]|uniref:Uncharacterized protein n=1 Tax=Diaporthe australafricana TaxID=127596 RepID=A0ABR3VY98_9PEZI